MKMNICLLSLTITVSLILCAFMILVPITKNMVPEYLILLILGLSLITVARYHREKNVCKLG